MFADEAKREVAGASFPNDAVDGIDEAFEFALLDAQSGFRAGAFGNFVLEFLRAFVDAFFKLVVSLGEVGVALLNGAQHVIETKNELAEFVVELRPKMF